MTIQELFSQVNKDDLFLSYIRRYDLIEPYDHRGTVAQEVKYYKIFKEKLNKFVNKVKNTKPIKTNKKVFVIDLNAVDFEDKNRRVFDIFYVNIDEYNKKVHKDFKVWAEPSESTIQHYGFLFNHIEEIAGYEIANKSIEEYGKEAVAAAISHELSMFDFGEDEEGLDNLVDSLKSCIENQDEIEKNSIPADEVFAMLKNKYRKDLDEDTKKYFEAHDKFQAEVQDICDRWDEKTLKENHQQIIDFLKAEAE